jgi:hypothetical protein
MKKTSSTFPCLIEVSVQDTGSGIPEDKRHRLFKNFSQVDESITREHGGSGKHTLNCSSQLVLMLIIHSSRSQVSAFPSAERCLGFSAETVGLSLRSGVALRCRRHLPLCSLSSRDRKLNPFFRVSDRSFFSFWAVASVSQPPPDPYPRLTPPTRSSFLLCPPESSREVLQSSYVSILDISVDCPSNG